MCANTFKKTHLFSFFVFIFFFNQRFKFWLASHHQVSRLLPAHGRFVTVICHYQSPRRRRTPSQKPSRHPVQGSQLTPQWWAKKPRFRPTLWFSNPWFFSHMTTIHLTWFFCYMEFTFIKDNADPAVSLPTTWCHWFHSSILILQFFVSGWDGFQISAIWGTPQLFHKDCRSLYS